MKKFWLIFGIIVSIAIVVAICLVIFLTKPKQESVTDDNKIIVTPIVPTITAQDITLYTNQTKDIIFDVECEHNYTINILCNFDELTIINNTVKAIASGEYYFDIVVQVDNLDYIKRVNVYAITPITQIEYQIYNRQNNIVDKLFVGDSYIIKIMPNSKMLDGEISLSENLSDIQIQNFNNTMFVSFNVESYDNTKFVFSAYNFLQEINIDTYCYINNFNVNIERQDLYLFNTNYATQANIDGKYNFTLFEFGLDDKNYNSYEITLSNPDVVQIVENKIIAKSCGTSYINFVATDGSGYTEKYLITTQNILISQMNFVEQNVILDVNQSYTPSYVISPIYAICNLVFDIDFDESISFALAGNYTLTLTDRISNNTCQMTFVIKDVVVINYQLHFNNSFLTEYNATYQNDTLTLTGKDTTIIYFDYSIISTPAYTGSILSVCEIVGENIDYNIETNSNMVILATSYKGSFDLKLSLQENTGVTYVLHIVIQ